MDAEFACENVARLVVYRIGQLRSILIEGLGSQELRDAIWDIAYAAILFDNAGAGSEAESKYMLNLSRVVAENEIELRHALQLKNLPTTRREAIEAIVASIAIWENAR